MESWNEPTSWFPSSELDGTPGRVDPGGAVGGFLRPGDTNLDGRLDVSDVVAILRLLFSGTALPLPCEGVSLNEGGNLLLLDHNGDEAVDLADAIAVLGFLFQEGSEHALGRSCTRIEGCPNACGGL